MKEIRETKDKQYNQRKNALNWFVEEYIKTKDSLRKVWLWQSIYSYIIFWMKSRGKAYYTNRVIITLLSILVLSKSDCPTGTTGFNCVACPTGCDTCTTNSSTCDVCSKGYYISSSTCIQCPTNCLQCDTPTYCINCIPGYDAVTNAAGQ